MLLQRGETHAPRLVPSYCITFSASEVVPLTACTDPVHWDRREFLRTAGDGSVDQAEHVIRWRHGERDQRQSNSRLVEWSDGSMTLHVGTEAIFQVVQVAQPPCSPGPALHAAEGEGGVRGRGRRRRWRRTCTTWWSSRSGRRGRGRRTRWTWRRHTGS